MQIVELNHMIDEDIPVFPGFPVPKIGTYLTHDESKSHYDGKAEFHISKFELVASIGTYIDAPYHRHRNGELISDVPLADLLDVPGVVVEHDLDAGRAVYMGDLDVEGKAVLFKTGWDENWRTDGYYYEPPFLADETVEYLVSQRPALVGVDFGNVDNTGNPARPAHTKLLGKGIFIVESLTNLGELPETGFTFNAVPVPVRGISTSPIRAYARLG